MYFNIYDSVTDIEYDFNHIQNISIITDSLGIVNYEESGPLNRYLDYGDHRYFVSISFLNLNSNYNNIYPNSYQLFQNFPNPFNPTTIIEYELPRAELVSLKIFDIMGREVISLVNKLQNPGQKFVLWDGINSLGQPVSAGMYIYTIQVGKFVQSKKMVLLK